jgi:glyoxylase-like metal-dependent hydrolase (beta-lactamase superfamily II)
MHLGDLELHLLMSGRWKADGGLMFGVVPKVLWQKQKPADENNMIECACVCLIARINGRVIVCETGIGTKLSEKRAQQVALREPEGMLNSLQALGIRPDEVDAVVTTHLHWDHAGGLTRARVTSSSAPSGISPSTRTYAASPATSATISRRWKMATTWSSSWTATPR